MPKKPAVPEPGQFIGRMISAFNGAFNDPSLIDYANQQGTDIPESGTPLNNSRQSPIPSEVAIDQIPLNQQYRMPVSI